MADKPNKSHTRIHARVAGRKKKMLKALEQTLGIVTSACIVAKVSRTQYYEWLKTDKEFADAVAEIAEIALDFVEEKLFKNIKLGDTQSIHYYLKCKGAKRGYGDRQEIKVEMPQFNDNRTEEEVQNILRERMRLYGGNGEQGKHRVV